LLAGEFFEFFTSLCIFEKGKSMMVAARRESAGAWGVLIGFALACASQYDCAG
jgi:hypothetical protein